MVTAAGNSDLFDVLGYVGFAFAVVTRAQLAAQGVVLRRWI